MIKHIDNYLIFRILKVDGFQRFSENTVLELIPFYPEATFLCIYAFMCPPASFSTRTLKNATEIRLPFELRFNF